MDDQTKKFVAEVESGLDSFEKKDRSFDCKNCSVHYVPASDEWIFYSLCRDCFVKFDNQKMVGRWSMMDAGPKPYIESSEDWIAAEKAK